MLQPVLLHELVSAGAQRRPEAAALTAERGLLLSYAELEQRVAACAAGLLARGLGAVANGSASIWRSAARR